MRGFNSDAQGPRPDKREEDNTAAMIASDLHALRAESGRDLPPLAVTDQKLSAIRRSIIGRNNFMSILASFRGRPLFTPTLVSAAVALLVALIPISYDKTVGQEVAVTLSGADLTAAEAGTIGNTLAESIGSNDIRIYPARSADSGEKSYRLVANVESRSKGRIGRLTAAVATDLASRGYGSSVSITPIVERVSSNVYAAGFNRAISLDIVAEGRSDDEVMADIRGQLEDAGCGDDVDISFSRDGEATMLTIMKSGLDGDCSALSCDNLMDIRIDGENIDMDGARMIKVCGEENMSDLEIEDLIREQLEEQGVDAEISVIDGKCQIERR